MSTKKGNDSDDEYTFDPLEALADVVTGDAFTFFDEPIKAVEKATETTNDTRAESGAGKASGSSGGKGQSEQPVTIKPLPAPTTGKGETAGKQKQAEGGNADGGGKEGDGAGGK